MKHDVSFDDAVEEFLHMPGAENPRIAMRDKDRRAIPAIARTVGWIVLAGGRAVAWGDDLELALELARRRNGAGPLCVIPGHRQLG